MVIGVNPDGELWFLYSLFVISAFAYLTKAKVGKVWIICSGIIGGDAMAAGAARERIIFPILLFLGDVHKTA